MKTNTLRWSDHKSLLSQLTALWDKGLILKELINANGLFPKRLILTSPDSKALSEEFDAARLWITNIQKLNGFRIVYKSVRHPVIGRNTLPSEIWVDNLETVISMINKQQHVKTFTKQLIHTEQQAPQLVHWIYQHPIKALGLADSWPKIIAFIRWRIQHPDPGIYLRQVSLPGIDSKFIERHRSILAPLLDLSLPPEQIDNDKTGVKQFDLRYGFRNKPERVRLRVLDPSLSLIPGKDRDLSITARDFKVLNRNTMISNHIKRIFITENEINFLAFPSQHNSLVLFGSGYGFDTLSKVDWLLNMDVYYWGDIDTHGFAILNQLRTKLPHTKSLLMDEETLLSHREFWGNERQQKTMTLEQLTTNEQDLYQSLLTNKYELNLRLEQERISFDFLITAITDIDGRREKCDATPT